MGRSSRARGTTGFAWVLALGLAGELVAAPTEPAGFWDGDLDAPVPATLRGAHVLHASAVAALLRREPQVVIVDVSNAPRRPAELAPGAPWMPLPHRALPGALWFPGVGGGSIAPEFEAFFRTRLHAAAALDTPLLVYCHDRCWLSWNAAKRALGYGYRRVYWFPEGIEGWVGAGGATAPAAALGPGADVPPPRGSGAPSLVVLDLELAGDTGGPEFEAEHARRLAVESERLRLDVERTGLYQLRGSIAAQGTIDKLRSQQAYLHDCNGCDLDIGRELQADLVMVAWVDRVSGLILSLTYEIHDVKTSQIVARKSFDFRGDNDNAWNHAIDYMVRDLAKDPH